MSDKRQRSLKSAARICLAWKTSRLSVFKQEAHENPMKHCALQSKVQQIVTVGQCGLCRMIDDEASTALLA